MTCWPPADARRPAMGKATRPPRSHLAAQLGLVFGLWRCAGGAAGLHRARQPLLNAEVPEHFSLLRCGAAGRPAEARQLVWKRPVSNFAHRSRGPGRRRESAGASWPCRGTCFSPVSAVRPGVSHCAAAASLLNFRSCACRRFRESQDSGMTVSRGPGLSVTRRSSYSSRRRTTLGVVIRYEEVQARHERLIFALLR